MKSRTAWAFACGVLVALAGCLFYAYGIPLITKVRIDEARYSEVLCERAKVRLWIKPFVASLRTSDGSEISAPGADIFARIADTGTISLINGIKIEVGEFVAVEGKEFRAEKGATQPLLIHILDRKEEGCEIREGSPGAPTDVYIKANRRSEVLRGTR